MMKLQNFRVKNYLLAVTGVFLLGVGVAFNAMARLGNDPVGIFYDGIRNSLGLSQSQLGISTYIVNVGLILLLFVIGRRYLNAGTFINLVLYGTFVKVGTFFYLSIFKSPALIGRIAASVLGCLFIYTGVSLYIIADVGLDPMTALTMVLKDKLGWNLRKTKILFDVSMVAVGFAMGGKLGVITVVTAFTAGPSIQFIIQRTQKKEDKKINV